MDHRVDSEDASPYTPVSIVRLQVVQLTIFVQISLRLVKVKGPQVVLKSLNL